ncbi:uncharacterized protein SPPG_04349 [Spizellomyces punctatus DAOM BR117]|uniref:P-loop containing nucleoside triphosphate hydrolase protein n=1 Tax=Spizellomyces punctatus (strain DAOM BR117) TaxID=645134 RepID=A0A0L0HG44_SPIPD|nr:uncharacterized protein SPPG_04349 [Spizellomyces punctatus DAOM BR117]KND00002.1 hypothetical protein SPPG_04349 [Spizellomyces punctatus DAOM BR117]|eukprot:XP_016608041.1 hypothetical protein SPPG_04349 [Spizellomyces punctatus DAOM BR117]
MAGGSAARANRQKKGKRNANGKRGNKDRKTGDRRGGKDVERRGGGFRGVELVWNPVTGEVVEIGKKQSAILKEKEKRQMARKWQQATKSKKEELPRLHLTRPVFKRLATILSNYHEAQKVLRQVEEGDDDDYEEDDEQDIDPGMEELIRDINGPRFYHDENKYNGESDEEDFQSDGSSEQSSLEDGEDAETNDSEDDVDEGFDYSDDESSTGETTTEDVGSGFEGTATQHRMIINAPTKLTRPPPSVGGREHDSMELPFSDTSVHADSISRAWLESLGFTTRHAVVALQRCNNDQLAALSYLYSQVVDSEFVLSSDCVATDPEFADEANALREQECKELESVYGKSFTRYTRRDGTLVWQITGIEVEVPGLTQSALHLALQLHHPKNTMYPFQAPVVVLDCSNKPEGIQAGLLSLAISLQMRARDHLGETVMDMLASALQTNEAQESLIAPSVRIRNIVAPGWDATGRSEQKRVLVIKGHREKEKEKITQGPKIRLHKGPRGGVPTMDMIRRAQEVAICLKEDQGTANLVTGIVGKVLTRGDHPRGIKVQLTDGRVGRVQALVERCITVEPRPQNSKDAPILSTRSAARDMTTPNRSGPPKAPDQSELIAPLQQMRINPSVVQKPMDSSSMPKGRVIPGKLRKPPLSAAEISLENEKLHKEFIAQQQRPQYKKMRSERETLPVWKWQQDIVNAVEENPVVVVEGETGCGKTTQVPQFLLDALICQKRGAQCKILVTQPRRISAIGVAERVAAERDESLGKTVGYQIRLENRMSDATRILFATTGILLRRLEGAGARSVSGFGAETLTDDHEGGIDDLTHIIVDEVHERSIESDFLLMVLRDLLLTQPRLKLVLMSATLNAELFQAYFGQAPRIHVPGRTFHVQVLYLEDALAKTGYQPEGSDYRRGHMRVRPTTTGNDDEKPDEELQFSALKKRYPHISDKTLEALKLVNVERIQYPLIALLVEWMSEMLLPGSSKRQPPGANTSFSGRGVSRGKRGHGTLRGGRRSENTLDRPLFNENVLAPNRGILIFLPGYAEIATLHELLRHNPQIRAATSNGKYLIPLHGDLPSAQQLNVFKRPEDGYVKVIIATNVAETSITVDDVVYVIDSGKMKETRFDPTKGMASLEECWVSRANALQRRGRAGRVTEGTCVHLFTSHMFENTLAAQQVPEMRRTPLEQLCLRIKVLPFLQGRIAQILAKVIEPPSHEAVQNAVLTLRTLQALTREETLTPLGFHLGRLPVDVRIGKLLILGSIFHCVDPVLTIAAAMSMKSPFVAPFEKREMADRKKAEFASGMSDQLTILNAYRQWQKVRSLGQEAERTFLRSNFLSWKVLGMIASVKRQLAELLSDIGFLDSSLPLQVRAMERAGGNISDGVVESIRPEANARGDDLRLVKAVLIAALYPNVIQTANSSKPAGEPQLKVRGGEEVFIHPSSVNYRKMFPTRFLVYHEKVKTSKVYIRDSSVVTPYALAFFGGNLTWDKRQKRLNMGDGWIAFRADPPTAGVIEGCRAAMDELLARKIQDPTLDISGEELIDAIVDIINMQN